MMSGRVELRYGDDMEWVIRRARILRWILWLPIWAMGVLFVVVMDVAVARICGGILCFLVPVVFESCLRKIENAAVRLKDTRVVVDGNTLQHVDWDGNVLASIPLQELERRAIRKSSHAAGHCVYHVYPSKMKRGTPVVFTTHIDRVRWLVCDILGDTEWPPGDSGG